MEWIKGHWAVVLTAGVVIGTAAFLVLSKDPGGSKVAVIFAALSSILALWSLDFVRRESHLSSRPYLAITSNSAVLQPDGRILVGPSLINAGRTPGRTVSDAFESVESDGTRHTFPSGTRSNIVYVGETINVGRQFLPKGGALHYRLSYEDLKGRETYSFEIEYGEKNGEATIREKRAT